MAEQKFQKGSKEWMMFQDFWKLCQKYWIVEDGDEYWDSLVDNAGDFVRRYDNTHFAKELAYGFVESQEVKYREEHKQG